MDKTCHSLSNETQHFLDQLGFFGWQLGLERIEKLCRFDDQPQLRYPTIHIAGTNGKGSTATMVAAIAQEAGLRVGLYTSPHLFKLNERIQINSVPISFAEIEDMLRTYRPLIESLQATYFETMTVIAFAIFAQQQVEFAVIETGLGGRFDATNVVKPQATIITNISLEHQRYLGSTLAQIAKEKAGIIKPGIPCISGVRQKTARDQIMKQCQQKNAPFYNFLKEGKITELTCDNTNMCFDIELPRFHSHIKDVTTTLCGKQQAENAALVALTASILREQGFAFDSQKIRNGLKKTHLPYRFQMIQTNPIVIVDVAHNTDSMNTLVANIKRYISFKKTFIVMALLEDKPIPTILKAWQDLQPHFFFAPASIERNRPSVDLVHEAKKLGYLSTAFDSPGSAFQEAYTICHQDDLLCITGSHYLIGDLIQGQVLPEP